MLELEKQVLDRQYTWYKFKKKFQSVTYKFVCFLSPFMCFALNCDV